MQNNPTVIITGATGTLGEAIAKKLSGKNYGIILVSKNLERVKKLKKILHQGGRTDIEYAKVNISKEKEVINFVHMMGFKEKQKIILINNAAISGPVEYIENSKTRDWIKGIEVNLYGAYYLSKHLIPHMKQACFGKIINICGGGIGWAYSGSKKSAYRTSKYALYGLTEALSVELAGNNIDVVAINPGSMESKLQKTLAQQENIIECENRQSIYAAELIENICSMQNGIINGKIVSPRWDDLSLCQDSSMYTLKRIDGRNYIRTQEDKTTNDS